MTPATGAEVLAEARAVIGRNGWRQGPPDVRDWPRGTGPGWDASPACLTDSLRLAVGIDPYTDGYSDDYDVWDSDTLTRSGLADDALKTVHDVLRDEHGYVYAATSWNDDSDRQLGHVLALLVDAERLAGEDR